MPLPSLRQQLKGQLIPGYGVKYNIWEGRYYGGDYYFHHKTNMPVNSWNMAMVEAVGYSYGANQAIRCAWGWHVSFGGLYNIALENAYGGMNAVRMYTSSDGYAVFVAYTPSYYTGWSINSYTLNPTGNFDLEITAVAQVSSDANYF